MSQINSKNNNHYYNKSLNKLAKKNKHNMTKSATYMWKYILSKRQMQGYRFRRERPILNYIADFACLQLKLIIEVDGITHLNPKAQAKDKERDMKLKEIGFTTLRFSSGSVLWHTQDVFNYISNWVDNNKKS